MKKVILIFSLIIGFTLNLKAQLYMNDLQLSYSPASNGVLNSTMCKTADGGFISAITVASDAGVTWNTHDELVVCKLDDNYNVLMEKKFSAERLGALIFFAIDIIEKESGGAAIVGSFFSPDEDWNGFLLQLNADFELESLKIYSTDQSNINGVYNIAEHEHGFIMTAFDPLNRGIIFGTEPNGTLVWSISVYDDEYPSTINTYLSDLIPTKDGEFAITGSVNSYGGGQPNTDDQDLLIIKINKDGDILGNWVYEKTGKIRGDGQPSFLDGGAALTYNPLKNTLTVVGTSGTLADPPSGAGYGNRVLISELDYASGNMVWATQHEINQTIPSPSQWIIPRDVVYNRSLDEYAVCGVIYDHTFVGPTVTDPNGFILRIAGDGSSNEVRVYGTATYEDFTTISLGTTYGGYTANGLMGAHAVMPGKSWWVESYQSITAELCNEVVRPTRTSNYGMKKHVGHERIVDMTEKLLEVDGIRSTLLGELICGNTIVGERSMTADGSMESSMEIENSPKSSIYPTLVSDMVTIVNNNDFRTYTIYSINGGKIMDTGNLEAGENRLSLNGLRKGTYFVKLTGINGENEAFKFIVI